MVDYNLFSDSELYQICIEGDEDAWQYLYNYILTICGWKKWELNEPEELAQEIALHLIDGSIKKVKEKARFRNFIKVMTINKIKDHFRRENRFRPEPLEGNVRNWKGEVFTLEHPDPKPSAYHPLIVLEEMSIVNEAIKKLPGACQKVVTEYLNFKIGIYKDYRELSKILKMPVPTISSRVSRCLEKLLQFKEIRQLRIYR